MPIDERLFAHINNDPFLGGSYQLEGNHFENTIDFLNTYLQRNKDASSNAEIKGLQMAVNEMLPLVKQIDTLSLESISQDELLTQSTQIAHHFIEVLLKKKPNEMLLMPGGWSNAKGGHAMIYQFLRDDSGTILFRIHNSGAGLEYHEKQSQCDKEYYNPILTYQIPAEAHQTKRTVLDHILGQIISLHSARVQGKEHYTAFNLYKDKFAQLEANLDATIKTSTDSLQHWLTGGQISGTCTQKSLHQMLKSCFSTPDGYRKFIYDYKMYSLEEYFKTLKQQGLSDTYKKKLNDSGFIPQEVNGLIQQGLFTDPQHLPQIQKAIRHNLRLLNTPSADYPNKALFDDEKIKTDSQRLTEYSRLVSDAQAKVPNENRYFNERKQLESHFKLGYIPFIEFTAADNDYLNQTPRVLSLPEPHVIKGGQRLLDELEQLIKHAQSLKSYACIEQLELFFNQLPLPQQFENPLLEWYKGIDSEQKAMQFYEQLTLLQNIYFERCEQTISKQHRTPGMYLSKITVLAVIGHINYNFPIIKGGGYFHQLMTTHLLHTLAPGSRDAVQLAPQHPHLDRRLELIKKLYAHSSSRYLLSDNSVVHKYYNQIICLYPDLNVELTNSYDSNYGTDLSPLQQRIRQLHLGSLFYFFEHGHTLAPKFKPLIELFNLQKHMEQAIASHLDRVNDQGNGTSVDHFDFSLEYDKFFLSSPYFNEQYGNAYPIVLNSCLQKSKFKPDSDTFNSFFMFKHYAL